jgi:hypothetical protein
VKTGAPAERRQAAGRRGSDNIKRASGAVVGVLDNSRRRVLGRRHEARQFLQDTVHKPETLRVVFAAFDLAWAEMEKDYPAPASSRDDERHRLAAMMLRH